MDVENAWESTCISLLGASVGPLRGFDSYLSRFVSRPRMEKCVANGKEIAVNPAFPKGARFISSGAANPAAALNINSIKDTDSAISAVSEAFLYSGDINLGNSSHLARSNMCINSSYVQDSERVFQSKFVSHSNMVRLGECIFGSANVSETKFAISSYETYQDSRLFECLRVYNSSDCYFSANLEGCQNCMFSFNLRNKSNRIGNLELSKEKFLLLKKKLQAEFAEEMKKKKSMISVLDICGGKNE
jgi:hypothetical protein